MWLGFHSTRSRKIFKVPVILGHILLFGKLTLFGRFPFWPGNFFFWAPVLGPEEITGVLTWPISPRGFSSMVSIVVCRLRFLGLRPKPPGWGKPVGPAVSLIPGVFFGGGAHVFFLLGRIFWSLSVFSRSGCEGSSGFGCASTTPLG